MKISGIPAYSAVAKTYQVSTARPASQLKSAQPAAEVPVQTVQNTFKKALSPENVITGAEREFFTKLFPESSAQINRHQVFTRNGGLVAQGVAKGSLIDGRG